MITPQLPLGISPRASFRLENYVPGPNAEMLGQIQAMTQGQGPQTLFLHGSSGSGRSHLLQGACNALFSAGQSAAYLPLRQLADTAPPDYRHLEQCPLLAVDDVDVIAGRRDWEQSLVGLYQAMRLAGNRVIATANAPVAELALCLPDLVSRLGWGESLPVRPLDDEDNLVLLASQAAERGLELSDEAGRYLIARVSRRSSELLTWLDRLDQESLAAQRRLTVPFVRDVLTRYGGRV